jgi:hypothetical protein
MRAIERATAMQLLHCAYRYLANRQGDVKKLKLIFYTMAAEVIHFRLVAVLKTA